MRVGTRRPATLAVSMILGAIAAAMVLGLTLLLDGLYLWRHGYRRAASPKAA